jgi:hypothetical protein
MKIDLSIQTGMEIEGIGLVRFGMRTEDMLALLGAPNSEYNGRHEFRELGCFIDVKPDMAGDSSIVDAIEFWNDGEANVASITLFDVDVLRCPGLWVKALLQSRNAAAPADGWYVNLDVFVSGGNPTYAYEEIELHRVEGLFEDTKEMLLEELVKATHFTSFGFARKNYCADGIVELERLRAG